MLGSIDNLPFILPENKLDEIAVTLALQDYDRLEEIVNLCEKSGVHTKFIPDYNSLIPASLLYGGSWRTAGYQHPLCPAEQHIKCGCKARCGYCFGSLCGLIVTSPLLLIVAILIRATSKGPIIFSQKESDSTIMRLKCTNSVQCMFRDTKEEKKGWTTKTIPASQRWGADSAQDQH